MAIIDEFANKVLSGVPTFTLKDKDRTYYVMSFPIGKGRVLYHADSYCGGIFPTGVNAELAGIVVDKIIYVPNAIWLGVYNFDITPHPMCIKQYSDFKEEAYARAEEGTKAGAVAEAFEEFYAALPVEILSDEQSVTWARSMARGIVLEGKDYEVVKIPDDLFESHELVEMICTSVDIREETKKRLEAKKEYYTGIKAQDELVQLMLSAVDLFEPWELELSKALRAVEAQQVTLEFTRDGKTATEKFERDRLLKNLKEGSSISYYEFPTTTGGERLMQKLGLSKSRDNLRCSDITKVSFRGKTLYQKEAVV